MEVTKKLQKWRFLKILMEVQNSNLIVSDCFQNYHEKLISTRNSKIKHQEKNMKSSIQTSKLFGSTSSFFQNLTSIFLFMDTFTNENFIDSEYFEVLKF